MARGLHDTGEEFILGVLFSESIVKPEFVSVGLFDNSVDNVDEVSDITDITTEPTGGAYSRQNVDFGSGWTGSKEDGDWQSVMEDIIFDTSDSDTSVDSYFVIVNFQSQDKSDSQANDHFLFTCGLGQSYDLGSVDTLTLTGAGVSIS